MYEILFAHISNYTSISDQEKEILKDKLEHKKVSRKEFLLTEFEVCDSYYFVLSGCIRLYKNTDNGNEQILQFGIEKWWISDYNSFETQKPSEYNLQAIEDTEVLILKRADYNYLFTNVPCLNTYFRLMMQKAYSASLKKMEIILCHSAEERYQQFSTSFPGFVQRIPQYMLASFLGFTPQFLSMLRAKKDS
ncbi:cAMP-binding domain of CRP or a regulatory subunit of cAMP-dependent protein kinases [Flavobacterium sp. CF108]|uniref:Crp/Fnr family transcriptional regulator n=1 Tax=unclassified Flavobacterium TaxID=196869 RepID=UPI0008CB45A3|nr:MULTISPECIES: Crp/Fnr family transcriptional regulator [unclassified Flavobacterium]SEO19224.1 cAMP-binding domain of CRP or a regulatory subunit of cAMP-dependent protein kinases [Flavobacterium sp. fv08]SHG53934.1 cAMP-binding domain of CRP or a regulatory subunit of cAMP-dependent protein kinases [Flavobacterium sp. CF108]